MIINKGDYMRYKTLKYNIFLNGLKTLITMFFPLITFPYISRTLQVDNLGKVNFAVSIISYFTLIAGLGISTYAIREGARLRDDKKELNKFANEIFTINIISTLISYMLLAIIIFITPKLQEYIILISILSINIIGTTIGMDWIYSIYEDYLYITIRTIGVQLVSLILLFMFVKNTNDYIIYTYILVISTSGTSILNYIKSRKYIKIKLVKNVNLKKHIHPIIIIFASSVATTIYVNSDTTMLGIICGDYNVGIYSTSVKIYTICKTLMSSIIIVTLPRLSNYLGNNMQNDFRNITKNILSILVIILVPMIVGIFMVSKEMVLLLSGNAYLEAVQSLKILSCALFFSILGMYYTNAVLLPMKLEKVIMKATIISAFTNISLNIIFINIWKQDGAAITTLISEIIVFLIQYKYIKEEVPININIKDIYSIAIGSILIVVVCVIVENIKLLFIAKLILKVILSIIIYIISLLVMKNSIVYKKIGFNI